MAGHGRQHCVIHGPHASRGGNDQRIRVARDHHLLSPVDSVVKQMTPADCVGGDHSLSAGVLSPDVMEK